MHAARLDTRRSARMMLSTIVLLAVIQVLLAAFKPSEAHALNRWGGGYEIQKTMYGYIIYCEEPVDGVPDPLYASIAWRRTMFEAYGADLNAAIKRREELNLWFTVVSHNYPRATWIGKRCISGPNLKPEVFRKPWYYIGLEGKEVATDATWQSKSTTGMLSGD